MLLGRNRDGTEASEVSGLKISFDCIPCTINSFLRLLENDMLPQEKHEQAVRTLLSELAQQSYTQSPASLGRKVHEVIRELLDNKDPYKDIKDASNRMLLDHMEKSRAVIADSENPFHTALKLAIAGNVIDYGPQDRLDIWETIDRVLKTEFGRDDTELLRNELTSAKQVLYVGDNCGEIVMDRLFLETIGHDNVYFAVRESPVINDATRVDAETAGIDRLATIITTGDNAPGAIWEDSSETFRNILRQSDVVISKGQGNFEGLSDVDHPIYFLLVAKCNQVAAQLGVTKGDFVLKKFYTGS